MLAALSTASVARMRFPLGELTKPEVRELARGAGLPVADKRESQDLCFLAGTGKRAFLARHGSLRERPGAIVDRSGATLGRHRGQHLFTVGQRKGLGVAARGAALRARQGPRREHGHGRDARRAGHDGGRGARRGPAPPGGAVDRVKLRYRTRPLACRVSQATAARWRSTSPSRSTAPHPARSPA